MANNNNRNNRQNGNNQRNQNTNQQKTPPASTQTSGAENTPAEPVAPETPDATNNESAQVTETSSQNPEGTSASDQGQTSENESGASDVSPEAPVSPSEDTVVFAAPPPVADVEEPVAEEVVAESSETTSLEKTDNDDELVANLKDQFNAFVEANSALGTEPDHYQMSAKLAAQIARYVVRFPKVDVLDAVVVFFKEHLDSVCSHTSFMKGSTTLSEVDQQLVGFFYNFFNELARGQIVRIDNGKVLSVLKKPEFVNYHQRKMSVLKQMAKQK